MNDISSPFLFIIFFPNPHIKYFYQCIEKVLSTSGDLFWHENPVLQSEYIPDSSSNQSGQKWTVRSGF
jgi:hypothetical protein